LAFSLIILRAMPMMPPRRHALLPLSLITTIDY